ncbi:polysaccharide pyruvyl transferase family protein [Flavobacterium gelidilacus]|uniref:polysaccharide pyruvyl transferase family protein n=1 Tax=Flavobacterium gelidilacus TaxID=206041 RepID=UPI0003F70F2D|nr:polysaccharide pyruvyl transferase family protein [Flavobacterium gelidilacus]
MKKIAILTQPLHNNYGGILQNFALQTYLKSIGFEPVTVNIINKQIKYSKLRLALSICKRLIKSYLGDKNILFINVERQVKFLNTPGFYQKRFIKENINYVTVKQKLTEEFDDKNDFYAYIVGSDQIWRPRYSPFLPNYYLDFVNNEKKVKVAYSASFGVDDWETDEKVTPFIAERAKLFDAISVREESAINLCNDYLGVNVMQTLDPTMLLDSHKYKELIKDKVDKLDKNLLCIYVLDLNKDKEAIVEDISAIKQLKRNVVGKPSKKGFPSIESWINGFYEADFIVTDSFHGVVFSILFNKQFVCIGNKGRGLTRFNSILSKFKLSHKLVISHSDFLKRKNEILKNIEYDIVNEMLKEERETSERFIKNALIQ